MEVDTNMINEQVFNSEWYEHNIPVWGKLVAVTDDDVLADNRQIIDTDWTTKPVDQYTVNRDLKSTMEEYKEENIALNNKVNTFVDKYDNLKDRYDGLVDKYTNLHRVAHTGLYTDLVGTPALAAVATSGDYNDLSNKPTVPSMSGYATQDWVISKFLENSGKWDNIVEYLSTPLDNVKFKHPGVYLIADANHDNNPSMFALVTAASTNPNKYYLSVLDINGASGGFALGFDDGIPLYFNDQNGVDLTEDVNDYDRFALRGDLAEMHDQIKTELMQEIKPTYSWSESQTTSVTLPADDPDYPEELTASVRLLPMKNGSAIIHDFSTVYVTNVPSWVHIDMDDTTAQQLYMNISVDVNEEAVSRSAIITVRNHDSKFYFTVTQQANAAVSPYKITKVDYGYPIVGDGTPQQEDEYDINVWVSKNGKNLSPSQFENDGLSFKFMTYADTRPYIPRQGQNAMQMSVYIDVNNGYNKIRSKSGQYEVATSYLYLVDSEDRIIDTMSFEIERPTITFLKPKAGDLYVGVNNEGGAYIGLKVYTDTLTSVQQSMANANGFSDGKIGKIDENNFYPNPQYSLSINPVSGANNKYVCTLEITDFSLNNDGTDISLNTNETNPKFMVSTQNAKDLDSSKTWMSFWSFGFQDLNISASALQHIKNAINGIGDEPAATYPISGVVKVNGKTYTL